MSYLSIDQSSSFKMEHLLMLRGIGFGSTSVVPRPFSKMIICQLWSSGKVSDYYVAKLPIYGWVCISNKAERSNILLTVARLLCQYSKRSDLNISVPCGNYLRQSRRSLSSSMHALDPLL